MIRKAANFVFVVFGPLLLIGSSFRNLSSADDFQINSQDFPIRQGQVECLQPSEFYQPDGENTLLSWMDSTDPENSIEAAQEDACSDVIKKTQMPAASPTLTVTPLITFTVTPTNSLTPTPTITPTHYIASRTPSTTPSAQQCGRIEIMDSFVGHYGEGYYAVVIQIQNSKPIPIYLTEAQIVWYEDIPERMLWAMQFNLNEWEIFDDITSPTVWTLLPIVELSSGSVGKFVALFKPADEPLIGPGSAELTFDDNCVKSLKWNIPSAMPLPDSAR